MNKCTLEPGLVLGALCKHHGFASDYGVFCCIHIVVPRTMWDAVMCRPLEFAILRIRQDECLVAMSGS